MVDVVNVALPRSAVDDVALAADEVLAMTEGRDARVTRADAAPTSVEPSRGTAP